MADGLEGLDQLRSAPRCFERECIEESRSGPPQRRIATSRRDKRIFASQLGQRIDLRFGCDQSVPAYRFVDQFERLNAMFDRLSQRGDRRAEQQHKFAARAEAVMIAPLQPAPPPRATASNKARDSAVSGRQVSDSLDAGGR